ncbi:MAG: hypothetical protein RLZZ414_1964 [Bacteroidota bacterium]
MIKTTTASIEIVQNQNVILEKATTKSFFKKAYILENSLAIKHLIKGNDLPIVVDLSKIENIPFLGLYRFIHQKKMSVKNHLVFVMNSKYKFSLCKFLNLLIKSKNKDLKIFNSREDAIKWVSSYSNKSQ